MPYSGWLHTASFYFYAHAGTVNRLRPEDLGLGSYYFGIRYRNPANGQWYYKTTSQPLNERQNELLAQAIVIDVAFDGVSGFVNAPFGVGTVQYELIISSTQILEWTTSVPPEVIKLPSATINGVNYINSGSFIVNHWLWSDLLTMHWPSSGYTYKSATIRTSADAWTIFGHPDWLSHHVYRGGTEITGVNPYIDGDVLRLVPNSINSGENRSGKVQLAISGQSRIAIDVAQDGATPSSSYFFNDYDSYRTLVFDSGSYAILTVGSDPQLTRWMTTSGLGASFIDVWTRIYDTTSGKGTAWHKLPGTGKSRDSYWNNVWITIDGDLASQGIVNGHTYSIDITATNPTT